MTESQRKSAESQRKTTDRETVIWGLAEVSAYTRAKADIAGVGKGKEIFDSWYRAAEDAIALLQEQEAVIVHDPGAICPNCKWPLYPEDHPHYCGNCGKAVKWDD